MAHFSKKGKLVRFKKNYSHVIAIKLNLRNALLYNQFDHQLCAELKSLCSERTTKNDYSRLFIFGLRVLNLRYRSNSFSRRIFSVVNMSKKRDELKQYGVFAIPGN